MAKYKLTKPCYYKGQLYKAGETVDFGSDPAPKGSVELPGLVEKAKAAVAAKTPDAVAEAEDKLLKGAAK